MQQVDDFKKLYMSLYTEFSKHSDVKKFNFDISIIIKYYLSLKDFEELLKNKNHELFSKIDILPYINLKDKWGTIEQFQKKVWVYLNVMYDKSKKYYDSINNVELKVNTEVKGNDIEDMLKKKLGITLSGGMSSIIKDLTSEVNNTLKEQNGKVNIQNMMQTVMTKVGPMIEQKMNSGEIKKNELEESAKQMIGQLKNKIGGKNINNLLSQSGLGNIGDLGMIKSLFESAEDKKTRVDKEKQRRRENRMRRMRKELNKKYKK